MKLINSKKGVNDVSIASGIIMVFVMLGVLLPFINNAFEVEGSNLNTGSIEENVGNEFDDVDGSVSTVGGIKIIVSVLKMFFWTFGDLPFWLDGIFSVFRIVLVLILIKYIPFIGS